MHINGQCSRSLSLRLMIFNEPSLAPSILFKIGFLGTFVYATSVGPPLSPVRGSTDAAMCVAHGSHLTSGTEFVVQIRYLFHIIL